MLWLHLEIFPSYSFRIADAESLGADTFDREFSDIAIRALLNIDTEKVVNGPSGDRRSPAVALVATTVFTRISALVS